MAGLRSTPQSRTEPASRVERRMPSGLPVVFTVSRTLGLHHQTVRRCVERAAVECPWRRSTMARSPVETFGAKAWMYRWREAKDLGYPDESRRWSCFSAIRWVFIGCCFAARAMRRRCRPHRHNVHRGVASLCRSIACVISARDRKANICPYSRGLSQSSSARSGLSSAVARRRSRIWFDRADDGIRRRPYFWRAFQSGGHSLR